MKKKTEAVKIVLLVILINFFSLIVSGQSLPTAKPETVAVSSVKLKQINELVKQDISAGKLPGAVVIVGRKGKIIFREAFGNRVTTPNVEKMTVDTIFDVASLTKPVATATSIMILLEQGKLRLTDTVGKFIPEIEVENAKKITIQQLLTHTGGYAPDFDLRQKWQFNSGMLSALKVEKLQNPPGTKFVYSDIGFIVLGEIIQRISGKKVNDFAHENIFRPLSANDSFFSVQLGLQKNQLFTSQNTTAPFTFAERIAPTENIRGQQNYLGSKFEGDDNNGNMILRGFVHDPTASRMDGVAGHAGLFSTADDLARYCQMILNGGQLDGKRILSSATVSLMTSPNVVSEDGGSRGLGFDINTRFSVNRGQLFPLGSFGHTGFTGTGIWIDPLSETFVVFLSNRVHPNGKGDVAQLRANVSTVAASAINDLNVKKIKDAENVYNARILPQIESFKAFLNAQKNSLRNPTNAVVLNGIDVLEKNNFAELKDLRIGLVTNHTGRNRAGKQTIDILREAENVKLTALFSPEHGIRGELDQSKINDSIDEKTGLPIFSLYGETRKPKPEQLKDLDALVFDIQDIGTRFYTYISTLKGVLQEAAKAKVKVIVLDRPNPINGLDIEGAIADADKLNFVATHRIPVRHGMTIGELALMFNAEDKIKADVKVIKMEKWSRTMWFDSTNQTWVNPSPNMRSLTQATLYGGIGLLEFTNLSVGRGTDTPFEVVGAPWIDGQKLAFQLNSKNLSGVRFVPIKFKPRASVFKDEDCFGINIVITDRNEFRPVKTGIEIALALRKLYPNEWKIENYIKLLLNQEAFEKVKNANSFVEVEKSWEKDLQEFESRRALFLLY